MASRVVLITGVADYWGARLATRLLAEPELHVLGLDAEPPQGVPQGLDFVQADVRNRLLIELLQDEQVNTVCHLKFVHRIRPSRGAFEANVLGTRNLLQACADAGVGKVVVKSSLAVYGAHPDNPAFLTEAHALRASRRYGYVWDMVTIETLCNDFRHQAPQLTLTNLRLASIVGPTADTPLTRFLKSRWAPALLGFDPMLQLVHEADVIEALAHAALHDVPGVFNVAADGAMPLSRIIALSGKRYLPALHNLAYWGVGVLGGAGVELERYAPIELDYLRYSWVGDLTKMHGELGFAPRHSAEETLREFAARHHHRTHPDALTADEEQLRATLERRRRSGKGRKA
jgi:UDP-glucose 4-epimerase